jgi:hypothetical protein
MTEQGRIQDGTINDADEFWQLVQDVAYIIEGESRDYEREKLHWLAECLDKWLGEHSEVGEANADLHRFAMQSVARLAHAFVFNDGIAAGRSVFAAPSDDEIKCEPSQ